MNIHTIEAGDHGLRIVLSWRDLLFIKGQDPAVLSYANDVRLPSSVKDSDLPDELKREINRVKNWSLEKIEGYFRALKAASEMFEGMSEEGVEGFVAGLLKASR